MLRLEEIDKSFSCQNRGGYEAEGGVGVIVKNIFEKASNRKPITPRLFTLMSTFQALRTFKNKQVQVLTLDGRILLGTLVAFDQMVNIILADTVERIFSTDGVEEDQIGLQVIKGDHVACISLLNEQLDSSIDWSSVKAEPIDPIIQSWWSVLR